MDGKKEKISVGMYGICNWWPESGMNLINPTDVGKFMDLLPAGKVFKCIEMDGVWIKISYGIDVYVVDRTVITPIPTIKFNMGQSVMALGKIGTITNIIWHFKNAAPMYFLTFGGKASSRRYYEEELSEWGVNKEVRCDSDLHS